jgi:hypothetical protein
MLMYGHVKGASIGGSGAILLPNTGGNVPLTILAITAIVVGSVVLVSTIARAVVKKSYEA